MNVKTFNCKIERVDKTFNCMDVFYTYPNQEPQLIGVIMPEDVNHLAVLLPMFSRVDDWELFKTESTLSFDIDSTFSFVKIEPTLEQEESNLFTMPVTEI